VPRIDLSQRRPAILTKNPDIVVEKEAVMLRAVLLGFAIVVAIACAYPEAARARTYPYCLSGRGVGTPGQCHFATRQACLTAAAGRALSCRRNPRLSQR
jgi:Protein of unknown function (DUF3551)